MMKRQFWGLVITVLGVLATMQVLGVHRFGLSFWPVLMTVGGLAILWSSFKKLSWVGLALGLWIGSIGLFNILHDAGVTYLTGRHIAGGGWPLLLVAIGLSILFGRFSMKWIYRGGNLGRHSGHVIGEFRMGQGGSWLLDHDLSVGHGIGDVRVDLTTADITDGTHKVNVSSGIGDVVVRVPDNVNLIVTAKLGLGDLEVLSERRAGVSCSIQKTVLVPESPVTIELDAELGLGHLVVVQRPALTNRVIK